MRQHTKPAQLKSQHTALDVSGSGLPALMFILRWGFCVCSSQRSAARVRSLTEELEETRRAFKEAQERASRTQTSCAKLVNLLFCH